MASDIESKNGSKTGEEEERQNQVGEDDPKEDERFNWAEYHLFVSNTETGVKINAYTDQNILQERRSIQRIN